MTETSLKRIDPKPRFYVPVKSFLFRCFLVASLLWVVGCGGDVDPVSNDELQTAFVDEHVELMLPEGPDFPSTWKFLLDNWAAESGAKFQFAEYPDASADGHALVERLQTSVGKDSPSGGTICVFPLTRLPELKAAGLLTPIPETQQTASRLNWPDLFRGLQDQVASSSKKPLVVPLSCPVLVCYYRHDLLETAGLSQPETWEDYQKLLETMGEWAPGMTAVEPWGKKFRATMFLSRAVAFTKHPGNYSLFFNIQTGEPLIDTPGFVRALEEALKAQSSMPPEVLTYSPADCRQDFFAGKAALALSFETGPGNPPAMFVPVAGSNSSSETRTPPGKSRSLQPLARCMGENSRRASEFGHLDGFWRPVCRLIEIEGRQCRFSRLELAFVTCFARKNGDHLSRHHKKPLPKIDACGDRSLGRSGTRCRRSSDLFRRCRRESSRRPARCRTASPRTRSVPPGIDRRFTEGVDRSRQNHPRTRIKRGGRPLAGNCGEAWQRQSPQQLPSKPWTTVSDHHGRLVRPSRQQGANRTSMNRCSSLR